MNLLQLDSLFQGLGKPVLYSAVAGVIGLGTVLSNPAPSEAQVTINVTGGSFSGDDYREHWYQSGTFLNPGPFYLQMITFDNGRGTLITPYGIYTGSFTTTAYPMYVSGPNNINLDSDDFVGTGYVNGVATPFAGNLDITLVTGLGNPSHGTDVTDLPIASGTITLNTPNTLTGFSFEPPVTSTTGSSTTGSSTTGSSTTGSSTTGSSTTGSSTTGSSTTGSSTTGSSTTGSSTTGSSTTGSSSTGSSTAGSSSTGSSTAGSSTTGSSTTGSSSTSPSTTDIPELTATNFTTPEPLTEPGGAGQAALRSQGQQPQQFRPNGVHTRIIPTWTPGLYQ